MTFGERLANARKAKGKSMQEMASLLGISAPGYKRLEDGTGAKTFGKLPIIARTLDCRIDDLFPEMDVMQVDSGAQTDDDDSLDVLKF